MDTKAPLESNIAELLPKNGLVYSEKVNLSEVRPEKQQQQQQPLDTAHHILERADGYLFGFCHTLQTDEIKLTHFTNISCVNRPYCCTTL